MKLFLLSFFLACASAGYAPGFLVKWGLTDCFLSMPETREAAVNKGYTVTERPDGPLSSLDMYCLDDRVICILMDDTNYTAGMQIALSQDNFTGSTLDMAVQGYTEWAPSVSSGDVVKYWTKLILFIAEDALDTPAADRLAARDSSRFLQGAGVYAQGFNGNMTFIGNTSTQLAADNFTEQSFIPWMGRHHFYNMSANTTCESDTLLSYFALTQSSSLIAMGLIAFGQLPAVDGQQDYFERPAELAVRAIVTSGPSCLYNLAASSGVLTIHIYFIKYPWLVLLD